MNDANNNVKNADVMPMSQLGIGTELVIDGGVQKVLIETEINDIEKILTGALPDQVEDVDDITAG